MSAIRQFTVTAVLSATFVGLLFGAWQYVGTIGQSYALEPAAPISMPADIVVTAEDAPFVLNTSASVWDAKARESGGAVVEVTFGEDLVADVALAGNGDFTATTNKPSEPQWIHVGSTMYGRLGQEELAANRSTLQRLGKSDAVWTDAALLAEERRLIFSLAAMDNTIRSISESAIAFETETVEGRTFISATAPWTAFPELEALLPYRGTVNIVVTLSPERLPERITFSVAEERVATVSLINFTSVATTAPDANSIITMNDLLLLTGAVDDSLNEN